MSLQLSSSTQSCHHVGILNELLKSLLFSERVIYSSIKLIIYVSNLLNNNNRAILIWHELNKLHMRCRKVKHVPCTPYSHLLASVRRNYWSQCKSNFECDIIKLKRLQKFWTSEPTANLIYVQMVYGTNEFRANNRKDRKRRVNGICVCFICATCFIN